MMVVRSRQPTLSTIVSKHWAACFKLCLLHIFDFMFCCYIRQERRFPSKFHKQVLELHECSIVSPNRLLSHGGLAV